jgi:hypothetical protein
MTDKEIIEDAYKEIIKQIYREFHIDENETQFKVRVERAKKIKDKALFLLNGQ